jgi:hypothetical protein
MIDHGTIQETIVTTPVEVVSTAMLVVKLAPGSPHPAHAIASLRDEYATTVVIPESKFYTIDEVIGTKGPFRLLRFALPTPTAPRGFHSSISSTLALAGITVHMWSTFDAEYILVRQEVLGDALDALAARGFPTPPERGA